MLVAWSPPSFKKGETDVAVSGAEWVASGHKEPIKRQDDVQRIIHNANCWATLSLLSVFGNGFLGRRRAAA